MVDDLTGLLRIILMWLLLDGITVQTLKQDYTFCDLSKISKFTQRQCTQYTKSTRLLWNRKHIVHREVHITITRN